MRQNSLVNAFLTLVNLAVVALAVYLAVDALDSVRMQNARTDQAMNRMADSIDRLNQTLATLDTAPRAGHVPDVSVAPAAKSGGVFLNDDLRDPNAQDGGSAITRTTALPGTLNNVTTPDAAIAEFWGLTVDSLAGRNNNDLTKFEPLMAESWNVSADGLVYTITLKKNILWQPYIDPVDKREVAAKPVTAHDFVFYWNTVQNPKIPCESIRSYYELLDTIEAVDDHTLRVVWKEPYSMAETFTLGLSPLPEHYYRPEASWDDDKFAEEFIASPRNQWIVGTGPYKLVKWDKNSEVVFERDENYYGPKPPITERRVKLIPDNSVSFLEFQRGQLDVYGLQPTQWYEETPEPEFRLVTPNIETAYEDSLEWDRKKQNGELPDNYEFEKFQYAGSAWAWIGYNLRRPLFQDRQVRVALTHLVDRQRILDEVFLGLGTVISGPFVPHSPYYNHAIEPLPFDIAKAGEILKEAGWEDTDGDGLLDRDYDNSGVRKPFEFTFMIPSSSTQMRKWAAIIEQDMIKAKIKVNIKPIEWSVFTQSLDNRDFDACTLLWSGGIEGDPYQIWHGSGANREGSSNYIGYNSPEANRLIDEARRTIDKEKRYELYHRLHRVLAEDQPYTFLIAPTSVMAQNKRFRNSIVYKGGGMDRLLEWIPRSLQQVR
jgi:ABC-type dipeptide transport system, periplasmic component